MSEICTGLGPDTAEAYYSQASLISTQVLGGRGATQAESSKPLIAFNNTMIRGVEIELSSRSFTNSTPAEYDKHGDPIIKQTQAFLGLNEPITGLET